MSLPPQKFREIVLQIIFCQDEVFEEDALIQFLMYVQKTSKSNVKKCYEVCKKIFENKNSIDSIIQKMSISYDFERISKVEKMILRLSIFELIFSLELSESIIIAEAIRLSKKFGSVDSYSFIHAILDGILKKNLIERSPVADKD